ncbi:MAG: hypothetical protein JWO31_3676 [Phycisphaerales bacterium]|nr:hypothetical protein [Phycisphaerales bacterium]
MAATRTSAKKYSAIPKTAPRPAQTKASAEPTKPSITPVDAATSIRVVASPATAPAAALPAPAAEVKAVEAKAAEAKAVETKPAEAKVAAPAVAVPEVAGQTKVAEVAKAGEPAKAVAGISEAKVEPAAAAAAKAAASEPAKAEVAPQKPTTAAGASVPAAAAPAPANELPATQVPASDAPTTDVWALIADLNNPSADVAREAAAALGGAGDWSAVRPLAAAVENADGYYHSVVRAAAAASLGQLGDAWAVPALLNAVYDEMAEASAEAVRALAAIGDPSAVRPLAAVVRNVDGYFLPVVRRAAVLALAKLGGDEAADVLRAVANDPHESPAVRQAATDAAR